MKNIRIFRQPLSFFLTLLMISGTLSCYSRRQMQKTKLSTVDISQLHFVIVDSRTPASNMWLLSKVEMGETALSARIDRASPDFAQEIATINSNSEMAAHQNLVLFYVDSAIIKTYKEGPKMSLAYSDIIKIEVFKPDAAKIIGLVLGGIAATFGTAIIILIIACACPYVYAETPQGEQFVGELYAGAAFPQLERHDWLPLPNLKATDNRYAITLANRLFENQHTNLLELEALDAAPGIRPLYDKYGRLHTISAPQSPIAATNVSGKNVLAEVINADDNIFRGDLQNTTPDATEQLRLTFAKPKNAKQAKLLINAKNSFWMDVVYREFQDELGIYGPKVRQKYLKKSAAENLAWIERQKMPLAVWIETTPGHWEKSDYFNIAGPMAFKNDVLPIDLSRVSGDTVRLRLEYGFNFWEIDYAALDFSADQPVKKQTLRPASALTKKGEEVAKALSDDDDQYYDQPNIGDDARITFVAPPLQPGYARTFIMHAKGHYDIRHEPAAGRPNIFRLKAWEKENALPRLSRERWLEAKQLTISQ